MSNICQNSLAAILGVRDAIRKSMPLHLKVTRAAKDKTLIKDNCFKQWLYSKKIPKF